MIKGQAKDLFHLKVLFWMALGYLNFTFWLCHQTCGSGEMMWHAWIPTLRWTFWTHQLHVLVEAHCRRLHVGCRVYLNFLIVPLRTKQGLEKLCHWVIELQQSLSTQGSNPPERLYSFLWSVNRAMTTRLQWQLGTLEACIGSLEFLAWNSAHTEHWAQSNMTSLMLLFVQGQSTIKTLAFLKHD